MNRMLHRRPSPALVISVAALFVAIGGTALAVTGLTRNEVTSRIIAPGGVHASDIHANAVTPSKLHFPPAEKGVGIPSAGITAGAEPHILEQLRFGAGPIGSGFQERILFVGAVQVTNPANPGNAVTAHVTIQGFLNGHPVSGDAFVNDVSDGATEMIPVAFTATVGHGNVATWQLEASSTFADVNVDGGSFNAGTFPDAGA